MRIINATGKLITKTFPNLEKWWRQRKYFARARKHLDAVPVGEQRDQKAAEAMFYLNHVAKVHFYSEQIYAMKNLFVHALYEEGYCVLVEETEQSLACFHTRAYLEGDEEWCPKCHNTGIYRKHTLFSFTFDIWDKVYCWHQPAGLVGWNPAIGGVKGEFKPREFREIAIHTDWANMGQAVVWLWLKDWGVKEKELPEQMRFWKALRLDACSLWERMRRPLRRLRYWNEKDDPDWVPF